MSRWFRFYDDAINDPKVLKLSDRLHRVWIGLLCVASKNDGQLPSMEDCALMLRLQPERMAEALVSLVGAGLLDRDETGLSPHKWGERQYKSDVSTERVKRFRQQDRNGSETPPEQTIKQNRAERETGRLIEVTDEAALRAWDEHGIATRGKPYPRNRRGGWCHPSHWPPGHGAEVHVLPGRAAS
jgi:hypothetical protein